MSHSFTNLLFHLVWSTKNRQKFIHKEIKPRLYTYMRAVIEKEGAHLLYINGIEDHVHLLVVMPPTILIPDLIAKTKKTSSVWFNRTFLDNKNKFAWQEGYGAFTVGKSNQQQVINYIKNQEDHHKNNNLSYEDEFLNLLKLQELLKSKFMSIKKLLNLF